MPSAERDTFIKVSDQLADHPKVVGLSDKAFRAMMTLWFHCSRYKTDGYVSPAVWRKYAPGKAGRELLEADLAEVDDQGFRMHDYLKHQRSAAHIEAVSTKRAKAGQRGGKARPTAKQDGSNLLSKTEAETPPEDRGSTTYFPNRETDGSAPSERPDRGKPRPAAKESSPEVLRAQKLTDGYVERVPMSRYPAVLGVVRSAVRAGYTDQQIVQALARMADEGRSVTVEALRVEIEGLPVARRTAPRPNAADATVAHLQSMKTPEPDPAPLRALPGGTS